MALSQPSLYIYNTLEKSKMEWTALDNENQIEEINHLSVEKHVLIFKHSTRCPTSSMALNRLERKWNDELSKQITPYYLDLVQFRSVSTKTATDYNVVHESPQILIIKDGKCIYDTSHMSISVDVIKEQIH